MPIFGMPLGLMSISFEIQPRLLPLEDHDSSEELRKYYQKYGIKMSLGVQQLSAHNMGSSVEIHFKSKEKEQKEKFDMGLIAVGMTGVTEGFGLEKIGIKKGPHFIEVNEMYQTSCPHVYAVGDVNGPPLLAHVASHEGVIAAEHLSGLSPRSLDKKNIPAVPIVIPQVANVGYTEEELKQQKIKYRMGKLPFSANGKAIASDETEGFVKVLMGEHGEMLGAHIVGKMASELIHEYSLFKTMEGIDEEIFATVHPHPTLGEWLAEAVMAAKNRALNF